MCGLLCWDFHVFNGDNSFLCSLSGGVNSGYGVCGTEIKSVLLAWSGAPSEYNLM